MNRTESYTILRQEIPAHVTLVPVSKTKPADQILEVYHAGCRIFGESRVQELTEKHDVLPGDIAWHMIGHLQTNKVKYIAPFITLIHSVDSFRLLCAIDSEAKKNNRIIDCLLQLHIATEETKFGFSYDEIEAMLCSHEYDTLKNTHIKGLMGIATFTDDLQDVRSEFRSMRDCFRKIKERFFSGHDHFREISMGMSGDYNIAIEEGSTMIRVGSLIFGER